MRATLLSITPALAKTTHHSEHLADRVAMLAMRTMIGLQPPADQGPAGRTAFDELMTKTPSAEGVTYESAVVGGIPGWWAHPADAYYWSVSAAQSRSIQRFTVSH